MGTQFPSLICERRKRRVISSLGKIPEVAPSSRVMLQIVARSHTVSLPSAGPTYSNTFPTPPFTVRRRRSSRITSFAETHGASSPTRLTRTTRGIFT